MRNARHVLRVVDTAAAEGSTTCRCLTVASYLLIQGGALMIKEIVAV